MASRRKRMICEICDKMFSNSSNLVRHMEKVHHAKPGTTRSSFACDRCNDLRFAFLSDLVKHYAGSHGFVAEYQTLEFASMNEFILWKEKEEKQTGSRFIAKTGAKRLASGMVARYYICHRSGTFQSEGKGLRALKSQGSCKIGKYCFATMDTTETDSKVTVRYQRNHSEHLREIGHLKLSDQEREVIAAKLKEGVQAVLDSVREEVSGELDRIHLITRKDIANITAASSIKNPQKLHKDDDISVDMWVNLMLSRSCSVVRYYKQQSAEDPDGRLLAKDFMLVLMTDAQKEMLENFGQKKILIDATHGTNTYDFHLTSLVCMDECGAGFPVAFCISTRLDLITLEIFFSKIRDAAGTVETEVFMSDDAPMFYNAWTKTMGEAKMHLLCSWHVDRNWRQNIQKHICGKELQATVYKSLRVLLECCDPSDFHRLLSAFLGNEHPDIQPFLQYFKAHYASRPDVWAYCYKIKAGVNTNIYLESLHKVIKYCYMEGRNKQVGHLIHLLLKLSRDKLFERIIKKSKGTSTHQKAQIISSHKRAEGIPPDLICEETEGGWTVQSLNTTDTYYTVKIGENDNCTCELKCNKCHICAHSFSCNCMDYLIHFNLCKHIHAVAMKFLPPHLSSLEKGSATDMTTDYKAANIFLQIRNFSSSTQHHTQKEKTIALLQVLVRELYQTHLTEEQYIDLQSMISTLISKVKDEGQFSSHNDNSQGAHNNSGKLTKLHFYSVKKKPRCTKPSMRKSTVAEKECLKQFIFNQNDVPYVHTDLNHEHC